MKVAQLINMLENHNRQADIKFKVSDKKNPIFSIRTTAGCKCTETETEITLTIGKGK